MYLRSTPSFLIIHFENVFIVLLFFLNEYVKQMIQSQLSIKYCRDVFIMNPIMILMCARALRPLCARGVRVRVRPLCARPLCARGVRVRVRPLCARPLCVRFVRAH